MANRAHIIVVNSVDAPFNSTLQAVTERGVFQLLFPVPAGRPEVVNDLNGVSGLPVGTEFQIRVTSDIGAQNTASEIFVFNTAIPYPARFVILGGAADPIIRFIGQDED